MICPCCFSDEIKIYSGILSCGGFCCSYSFDIDNRVELDSFFSANLKYDEARRAGMESYFPGKPREELDPKLYSSLYIRGFKDGHRQMELEDCHFRIG